MKSTLLIFEKHQCTSSFDITEEQKEHILSFIDYTPEQYETLSELTGLSKEYFTKKDVDYCIEW